MLDSFTLGESGENSSSLSFSLARKTLIKPSISVETCLILANETTMSHFGLGLQRWTRNQPGLNIPRGSVFVLPFIDSGKTH